MIIGIDEVGRGCWAGPLVAAAVMLRQPITGLADSKLLSRAKREHLHDDIQQSAEVGLGWVSAADVDRMGLTAATRQAMAEALAQLSEPYEEIIIDGHINFLADVPKTKAMVKADALIPAVSAASIVAKVARDAYMREIAARFPQYSFDKHVGYGTALHLERLQLHGPCELHRLSYKPVKRLLIVND